jgi:parvulin-like peptidyl-prolyl isomerase
VGPVPSSYGLHLVLVRERVEAAQPTLAAVRGVVEREVLAERRKKQLAAMYERLLSKYRVVIDAPAAGAAASGARKGGS